MPQEAVTLATLNRGRVSSLAMGRAQELKRIALSAEIQTNFMPRVLGAMSMRAGLKYLGHTYNDQEPKHLKFVRDANDLDQMAVLELSDLNMRVRAPEDIVTRASVSSAIRGGDFSADVTNWSALSNPASLPLAPTTGGDLKFSPDGNFVAITQNFTTPYIDIYSISGTTLTKITTPPVAPAGGVNDVCWSPDSSVLLVAHATTPFITLYTVSGTGIGATFTKQSNIGTPPAGNGVGVDWSANGLLVAVAHATTPFITVYDVTGTAPAVTLTKRADPGTLPTGTGAAVAFSRDSAHVAIAHATSPFVSVYSIAGSALTKLADPGTLPAAAGTAVAWNESKTFMAVAHGTTPFVTIYSFSGSGSSATLTKITNPGTLPAAAAESVSFSPDDQFLAVGHNTTPFVTIYDFATGAPVKIANPGTLPPSLAWGADFSRNGRFLGLACDATPYIRVYETYQWLDRDQGTAASSYGSSSSTVVAGPVTLNTTSSPRVGYTIRQIIDSAQISQSGSRITVTFQAAAADTFQVDAVYVGHQAAAGDNYDFESAPTQLTFSGGSAGFTITNSATITSDEVNFTLNNAKDLVIAFHVLNDGMACRATQTGWSSYYRSAINDASTQNTSGYTLQANDAAGVQQVSAVTSSSGGGYLSLLGTQYALARRVQAVSISNADKNTVHALRIVVGRGVVNLRIGTQYGLDDVLEEVALTEGTHSIAFTPGANTIFVEVNSSTNYTTLLDSLNFESSGDLVIATPWSASELTKLRYEQSEDVIWVACPGKQQYRIERRDNDSWSIVKYLPGNGPLRTQNTSQITMAPSALTGDITITASRNFFKSTNVGSLMRIGSAGQQVTGALTAANQFTSYIKVTGVDAARKFTVTRTGTWVATITLQRSLAEPGTWTDVTTYTTNASVTFDDGLDNQVAYYRIGIKTGNYTSGTANVDLSYTSGSIDGFARITAYTSPTLVSAIVLTAFGGTTASEDWAEGQWSDRRGWPSAVALYEGRLAWGGKNRIVESVPDAFENFDETVEGASAPINRTIGSGPNDTINWLVSADHLILGGQSKVRQVRSSSFDELVTADNFNIKKASTQGSAAVAALENDSSIMYVERSKRRLFELSFEGAASDYTPINLTELIPEILAAGVRTMDIQHNPDTRIHCVLDDGTAAVLIFNKLENVICWIDIVTEGVIVDVTVMPQLEGAPEDQVYYSVRRTINGTDVHYFEKFALESECQGGDTNLIMDSFIQTSLGEGVTAVTGLDHLEGEVVVAWADGAYAGSYTVASGSITLDNAFAGAANLSIGLQYIAQFKSAKLPYAFAGGSPLNRKQKVAQLGLLLQNAHQDGLKFAGDFDNLKDLPSVYRGAAVVAGTVHAEWDDILETYDDIWSTDSRICLQNAAPFPVTVKAVTFVMNTNG